MPLFTCLLIPQVLDAMLACARLGITHSVVFGGFAPHELAIRIDDCNPKAIITASAGIEVKKRIPYSPFVKEAYEMAAHKPEHIVVFDRQLWGNKVDWQKRTLTDQFSRIVRKIRTCRLCYCKIYAPTLYSLYLRNYRKTERCSS